MTVTPAFVAAAEHHLSLGLARAPLPAGGVGPVAADEPLKLLALAGQARRFLRPGIPAAFDPVRVVRDPRRIVPDRARPLLLEIDLTHGATGLAVADLMNRRALRLHPFDVARLARFVKARARLLGPSAEAFAARTGDADPEPVDPFAADAIDESNWTAASPGRKGDFIRALRSTDPARARELVQASFSSQNASSREKILQAFRVRLSQDDLPFLQSVEGDRAQGVRTLAADLVSRIPGTPAYEERIRDVMSRIKATYHGLLRRKARLVIDYPANVSEEQRYLWLSHSARGLSLGAMAEALKLSVDALVEAARGDDAFSLLVAHELSAEGRFDLLERVVESASGTLRRSLFWQDVIEPSAWTDPAVAAGLVQALLQPETWGSLPQSNLFERLYQLVRGSLPAVVFKGLLSSHAWRAEVPEPSAMQAGASYAALVPLAPAVDRPALRQALARLPLAASHRARLLLDLFDVLDPP